MRPPGSIETVKLAGVGPLPLTTSHDSSELTDVLKLSGWLLRILNT